MKNSIKFCGLLVSTIVVISLLFSCGDTSSKKTDAKAYKYASMKDGVLHLDTDKSRKDSSILNLSDICDSLIYIPLETREDCLLPNWLSKFYIDGDDLFFKASSSAFHFKTSGEFVCQLGKKGRGPKEYSCAGLAGNPQEKRIYVMARFKHKVLEFDYDGNLISDKRDYETGLDELLFNPSTKSFFYTSGYCFSTSMMNDIDFTLLCEYDLNGKIKEKLKSEYFPDKFFVGSKGGNIFIKGATTYVKDSVVRFQEVSSDTVFTKSVDAIKPYIVLDNSYKNPLTSDYCSVDLKKNSWYCIRRDKSYPSRICGESDRYVFIDYYSEPSYVYDKTERELKCVEHYVQLEEGEKPGEKVPTSFVYYNDMDGLNHISFTQLIDNKYLYCNVSALDLLDNIDKLKADKNADKKYVNQLMKIAEGLTEDSNPVIMLARLKN